MAAAITADPALDDPLRAPPVLGEIAERVMGMTTVIEDPELSRRYPSVWSARVTVRTEDGEERSELVEQEPGAIPQRGWDELAAKYRRAGCGDEAVEAARASCAELRFAGPGAARRLLSVRPMTDGPPTAH